MCPSALALYTHIISGNPPPSPREGGTIISPFHRQRTEAQKVQVAPSHRGIGANQAGTESSIWLPGPWETLHSFKPLKYRSTYDGCPLQKTH